MFKLLSLLFFLISYTAFSQVNVESAGGQYRFNYYTSEEGLLGSVAESIYQDSKGYIWICTRSGLNRWDGKEFVHFSQEDGLVSDQTRSVIEDENGLIWISSDHGVSVWNGKTFKTYTEEEGLAYNQVWSLQNHKDGGILIGTSSGIDLIQGDSISHFIDLDTTKRELNLIRFMNYDSKGNLWIASNKVLWKLNDSGLTKIEKIGVLLGWAEGHDGTIWIGSWGKRLTKIVGDSIQHIDLGTPITSIDIDKQGNLWLGSWEKGIIKYDHKKFIQFTTREGMNLNTVWGLTIDNEGSIWAATYGGGVNQLLGENFSYYNTTNGLTNNIVSSIVQDSSSTIWAATEGGVTKIPVAGDRIQYTEKDGLLNGKAQDICLANDQSIYFTLYAGTPGIINCKNDKLTFLPHSGGFAVLEDSKGALWFSTDGGGGHRLFDGKVTAHARHPKVQHNRVFKFFEDSNQDIWMGMSKVGWAIYSNDSVLYDVLPPYLRNTTPTSITEDDKGYKWLGLNNFIYQCTFDGREIILHDSITKENGFIGKEAAALLYDNGFLWVTHNKGISKLDLNSFYSQKQFEWKHFSRQDGFMGDPSKGLIKGNDGSILIATTKGVNILKEEYNKELTEEPYTIIRDVRLHKQTIDWSKKDVELEKNSNVPTAISLPWDENHLTFAFHGISMSAPDLVTYQYMLDGFDNDWSPPTSLNEITYSYIPPGKYTFLIRSINKDGIMDSTPEEITITITPPYWKTAWFRVIAGIFGLILIWFFIRLRSQKLEKAKKRLEHKVLVRTKELNEAYDQLEEKSKEITDSIQYAKRIQEAIMPTKIELEESLKNAFVLYKPKDVVSGDFYWMEQDSEDLSTFYFAAADCTGHGVPGAMVSVVCSNALNKATLEEGLKSPGEILNRTRELVIKRFDRSENVNDGMDIALCKISFEKNVKLEFAGAFNPLWILRNGEFLETKGNKQPIGNYTKTTDFTNHNIEIKENDIIYVFSDGFQDQFGGARGKKFKAANLKKLLISISEKSMPEQHDILLEKFEEWRGDLEQIDDVCVIGVRV